MKCLCGYEYLEEWQADDGVKVGDKEFIYLDFGLYPIEHRNWGSDIKRYVKACPECGTLKIDV